MSDYLNKITNRKKSIITGEIGALLHDIGKCHPNFIKTQSLENVKGLPHHARDIDKFISHRLIELFKRLTVKLNDEEKSIYDFIQGHHDARENLLKCLGVCDKKDSADDKGVVRKKQPLNDTWISSPFGYRKEKIDIDCLQKRFNDLQDNLIGLFQNYTSEEGDLTRFRESLINNLKTAFSHALGETRIPANDVTLWDHSYSTASLFKTLLVAKVCGLTVNPQKAQWRIFGICWNGYDFINRGKKIGEIQAREKIIEDIKSKLKKNLEEKIPIGNAIYEDLNGIYFTFPDLDNNSEELAKELAQESLKIVYDRSDNEIWPFFTLSKASSTLTAIAKELKFAVEKRKIPKMTPTLFFEVKKESENEKKDKKNENQNKKERKKIIIKGNIDLDSILKSSINRIKENNKDAQIDICPLCRIRPKDTKGERCEVCDDRRKGRLGQWFSNREETIWTDEVADKNNRIALISLNFYLDKWLDGTMIGTIYSQSFEDWVYGEKKKKENNNWVMKNTIQLLREAGVNEELQPNKKTVYFLMDEILKNKAAGILDTFFQDVNISKNLLDTHFNNIKERIGANTLTKENLATFLFTQNPSPARLYRIWQEAEEFFGLILSEIRNNIYSDKWKRVKFTIDDTDTVSKLEDNTPYIIKIDNLEPQGLLVFHNEKGSFYTIESLETFKFDNKSGEEAVKEALNKGSNSIALEDKPSENLLKENEGIKPKENSIETEEYYPLIEITKSPLSLRLIVPASDSMKIIELITKLYNERFERIIGKLPLSIKLLVAKRKFPLYILLEAENRMLEGKEFKKQIRMNPWWDIDGIRDDEYYGFYPTTKPIEKTEKYTLDELSSISKGKIFSLYPGYFDFELLLGTTDRYSIYYYGKSRGEEEYKLFTGRPYYFYQISEIMELWDVLSSNLSNSQITFIEEMLTSKLREWRDVRDGNKKVILREFAEATLIDAFGNNNWEGLREETRFFLVNSALTGLLLDTIILFRHIIKKEVDENV